MSASLKKLSAMARSFVTAYLADPEHNATAAAIKAGYSKRSAQEQSSRLLKFPLIKNEIAVRLKAIEEKADVAVADVIRELKNIGFVDLRHAYAPDGKLLSIKDLPSDVAHAVAGVDTEELFEGSGNDRQHIGYTVKLRMNPKVAALELIGKYLKMFTDRVEHTIEAGVFERLERARLHAKKARQ